MNSMAGRNGRRGISSTASFVNAIEMESTYGQADEAEISDGLGRHDCSSRVGVGGWMKRVGGVELQRPGVQHERAMD
jgi:hypothetical protein